MTEQMRFQLDITDVEAKAARILDLLQKIAAGRTAGQSTSELETQLEAEFKSLEKSTGKTKEATSAIQELTRSKEKLGSVVGLLGGQFGGVVGQIGNVVELLMSGAKFGVVAAAVIAAVTLVTSAISSLRQQAAEARKEIERLREAEDRRRDAGVSEFEALANRALRSGVTGATRGIQVRAKDLRDKQGFPQDTAEYVAIAEQILGDSTHAEELAAFYALSGSDTSLGLNQTENVQKLRGGIRVGGRPDVLSGWRAYLSDMREAARAQAAGVSVPDPREFALRALRERENLNDVDVSAIRGLLNAPEEGVVSGYGLGGGGFGAFASGFFGEDDGQDRIEGGTRTRGALLGFARRLRSEGQPTERVIVNQTNIGTVHAMPPVYADSSYSVATSAPCSTNGARAIVP